MIHAIQNISIRSKTGERKTSVSKIGEYFKPLRKMIFRVYDSSYSRVGTRRIVCSYSAAHGRCYIRRIKSASNTMSPVIVFCKREVFKLLAPSHKFRGLMLWFKHDILWGQNRIPMMCLDLSPSNVNILHVIPFQSGEFYIEEKGELFIIN